MSDYKKTLHLPVTSFSMKANLTQREPEWLRRWAEQGAGQAMLDASGSKGTFIMHDGPPYANGHIHLGTALNKILKDIVIKSRNMQGYRAEYVPGWDCHGLPIELKVEHELGEKKRTMPPHAVRRCCRQYAAKFIDIQRKEFKRLGIFGTWDEPYMTMDPAYEAATARALSHFAERGDLVRSKKPIYWCCSCRTALAEAEVEYDDHTSPSVYVRFPFNDAKLQTVFPGVDIANTFVVIWTTTPWTLPNNMAVALHPELSYALVQYEGANYLLAADLVNTCVTAFGWDADAVQILGEAVGVKFENMLAKHPLYDRVAPIVLGDHVTLEAGTGAVHTAPGHGREDYEVGLKYGIDIYSPLDDDGRYLDVVERFAGMSVHEVNPHVIAALEEVGALLSQAKIKHSYPHCWRCKQPVIFRATTQWFISMDKKGLREQSLKAIRDDVQWIPAWGEERIYSMVETRPDWCISRQRMWGVPILALLCDHCNAAWQDPAWMRDLADRFAKYPTGCDYWYEAELEDIVPKGLTCPQCGGVHFTRESDILDVWFDSGTSFLAVLEQRPELSFPADLYLEGSDQHRGWFHSSLLACMGVHGTPPYRAVLTHGYVVDGAGRKMSKSIGNVVAPQEIIDKYGAEILRLWVSSVEYREDIRISDEILQRLVDAYRRIRNTCRYILGNISDMTLEAMVPLHEMDPLDRYAVDVMLRGHERIQAAYMEYEFHKVFHTLHNLCSTDLSAFYLDILKDRLYASAKDSHARRSAQTALVMIMRTIMQDMAPVLSFTADEVFGFMPEDLRGGVSTIFALQAETLNVEPLDAASRARWERLLAVRGEVTRAIEPLRKEGLIGHGLDTRVTVYADEALYALLTSMKTDLRAICIVSQWQVKPLDEAPAGLAHSELGAELAAEQESTATGELAKLAIAVEKAHGEKCSRCWIYAEDLGTHAAHPDLCPRCTQVVEQEGIPE